MYRTKAGRGKYQSRAIICSAISRTNKAKVQEVRPRKKTSVLVSLTASRRSSEKSE